jgi:hypothetical protein
MKTMKTLLLSLLISSLLPAQLRATIVQAEVWQRPNGTRVVILGDEVEHGDTQKQQVVDCLEHLKNKNDNAYILIARTMGFPLYVSPLHFSHTMANVMRQQNILYEDIAAFNGKYILADLPNSSKDFSIFCNKFLTESLHLQETIPAPLHDSYNQKLISFSKLIAQLPSSGFLSECCDPSIINGIFNSGQLLFIPMLATHLERNAAKESFLIVETSLLHLENSPINSLATELQSLGYTRIASIGTYTEQGARELYQQKITAQAENYPRFSDKDPIMIEVVDHFALNLKEIFNRWAPIHLPYKEQRRKEQERFNHPAPRNTNTMTPTEYRAWSKQYDKDMEEENLPITGFGNN